MSTVAVHLASDSVVFMHKLLITHGAVTGTPPNVIINPKIRLLVDALYEVLAGGTVSSGGPGVLNIASGAASVVSELKKMEADCTTTVNTINAQVGYSYVMEF